MVNNDMNLVISSLKEQNRGSLAKIDATRTIVLMDATGSMYSMLNSVKDTVSLMFERAFAVIKEKTNDTSNVNDYFFMQFVFYRNYNCDKDMLLQSSPWETKADNIRTFLKNIEVDGGMGPEAIEIGLWHAVKESETEEGLSQVILIGDMPAQSEQAVINNRTRCFGENYWSNSRFGKPTHYIEQLDKLISKQIKVHAFYLTEYAKTNFAEIANKSGGHCQELNTNQKNEAEMLTGFVTKQVLDITGGPEFVALYEKKYPKSYST